MFLRNLRTVRVINWGNVSDSAGADSPRLSRINGRLTVIFCWSICTIWAISVGIWAMFLGLSLAVHIRLLFVHSIVSTSDTSQRPCSSDYPRVDTSERQVNGTKDVRPADIQNIQEVDIKDEVSATDTERYSSMSTSHSITQLSSCNDHLSVGNDSVPVDSSDNVPYDSSDNVPVDNSVQKKRCRHNTTVRTKRPRAADKKLRHPPFACDVCHREFENSSSLKNHKSKHVEEELPSLASDVDGRADSRPYRCDVCGKEFLFLSYLKLHLRSHTGERPFRCNECNKTFMSSSALNAHLKTHTGERPFTCDFCSQTFARMNTLKMHQYTHTGERPFTCYVCQSKFTSSSNLKSHMYIHTAERTFVCEICERSFTQKGSLKKHLLCCHDVDEVA